MFRDVTPLVRPRTIAVVGASSRRVSQGNLVLSFLKEWGFPGRVIPVHPTAPTIDGLLAVSSPVALPEATDVAVVAVPAAAVVEVLRGLERAGVRGAIVFANGFSREDEEALRRFAATSAMVVHGPNCMGLINIKDRVPLYPTRPSERLKRGRVALVAQSGSAAISIMNTAAVGFSKVITVGSEFQTTSADYVKWFASDPETSVVGVVSERIAHPVAFAEASEQVHRAGKALVVLKVGLSSLGTAAAEAHTGALVGERDAYDGYFAECDIATARDYDELIASLECLEVSGRSRLKPGARIAVVGISGGQTALACDVAEQTSLPLSTFSEATTSALKCFLPGVTGRNPVDIGASVQEEERQLREAVEAVLADEDVDGLALIQDAQSTLNPRSLRSYEPILSSYAEAGQAATKPVVLISPTSEALHETVTQRLHSHGVPVLRGLREGFVAIRNLSKGCPNRAGAWAAAREKGLQLRPEVASLRAQIAQTSDRLSTQTCHRLLDLYGIPRVASNVVATETEALERAPEIGFPMVVKLVSRDVGHRSDVGGVVLGVEDEEGLSKALASITAEVASRLPRARIEGFELQQELRGSIEAMVGFTRSPPFGALLVVGTGGTRVELERDRALGLAPVSVEGAERMIRDTRLGRLLTGYRNLIPRTDLLPLARLVADLSTLAVDSGETISACDLNPVMVERESGVVHVVDALFLR